MEDLPQQYQTFQHPKHLSYVYQSSHISSQKLSKVLKDTLNKIKIQPKIKFYEIKSITS